ncbi:TPA: ribosomal protein L7/L12, partial [Bacillus mycoides]|nr:ribosomal protein L7/L12 [Bacillus mycoides]
INKAEINKAEINKELRQLVEAGKKVKAIKRVREAFGFSLLEAKQYVDKL